MKSPVRPELPTASVGSSQAPPAAVDNSAPSVIRPESTYKSGKVVQTNGATSNAIRSLMTSTSSGPMISMSGETGVGRGAGFVAGTGAGADTGADD